MPFEDKTLPTPEAKSQLTGPTISLPKGGGAIRGIGEKFSANPVTGTCSMSVPIATSPGRSGFGPQLSLSYDSGAGNSPFGFGWRHSLPSITRKTGSTGLPQYLNGFADAQDSDVFILSGAEDLVPLYRRDADGAWVHNAKGELSIGEEVIDGYRVRRYRPRIEGLFARIERWTLLSDPHDVHWRSISKDNILTLYGLDANSRIVDDPERGERIFSWLICETRDDKGNAVLYRYKAEDGARVDLALASERSRGLRDDQSRRTERYLKHIHYGNRTSLLDATGHRPRLLNHEQIDAQIANGDWMFEVVFDYGEHDSDAPEPNDNGIWHYRPDPYSSYRAGFEVRTTRLCQRVLMFHHFDGEAGVGKNCLVRSTDFTYTNAIYTFLQAVTQTGYRRSGRNGSYDKRSLPPLEFEYSQANVQDTVHELDAESLENLPVGLDGASYQWTDLHGEGLPGILTEQAGAWFYNRNLSPLGAQTVRFAPTERIAAKPNLAIAGGHAQFMDLAGDGQPDLVVLDGPTPGLFEHGADEDWESFRPFTSRLNRNMRDANLKFIDLDGDGHADVLITEDDAFVWHASLAEEGFGPARRVAQALDEDKGPRVVFTDDSQSIYLADLSGDGLTDLVRIRNGEVCYWPNLGYARFGAKVTMDNAPWFDHPDQFSHKRVRLGDIDGSGTTDIIYLHRDGIRLYFNQSGNGWSKAQTLRAFPRVDDIVSIVPADLFGNGTACLVWSSPLPGDARRQMRYLNLMGDQKPHLLLKTVNNLGAETLVQYAPSTKFYLQDKRDGRPWITKLPFPVHVVEKVTVTDRWRITSFASTYSYHHGYFDGVEREFRGFGRVEQLDTESYGEFASGNSASPFITDDKTLYQPPVKTVSWYHTGAFLDRERILTQFEHEYFPTSFAGLNPGSFKEHRLPPPDLDTQNISSDEWREALRACKGMLLRQEVYELDVDALAHSGNSKHVPVKLFSAAYHNCHIRCLQPKEHNAHAVFLVVESEAITYHYELDLRPAEVLVDPRIAHTVNLTVDEYGNVLQSVAIVYPRAGHFGSNAALAEGLADSLTLIDQVQREEIHMAYAETRYTEDFGHQLQDKALARDNHRVHLPCEVLTYELRGIGPESIEDRTEIDKRYFTIDEVRRFRLSMVHQASGDAVQELAYHQLPDNVTPQKRLVEHVRTLFFTDDLAGPLPFGQHGLRALPYENYKLALTEALLDAVFADAAGNSKLDQAIDDATSARARLKQSTVSGYLSGADLAARFASVPQAELAGRYWIRSGIAGFAPDAAKHFYLPERYTDPFGNVTSVEYDTRDLIVSSSTDALGNTTSVTQFDYRVLAPREMHDINNNLSEVFFDVLGLPIAMAVKGKGNEGDSLAGFDNAPANLSRTQPSLVELRSFFDAADLDDARARNWLGNATARHIYDFGGLEQTLPDGTEVTRWAQHPPCACGIVREQHVSQLAPGAQSPIQAAFEYSDGSGSVIVKKVQAEPEAAGQALRWVASGKTILNNKGKPVKQYEPYFCSPAVGHRYEEPVEAGVTAIIYYDAVGRTVRTEMPDGSYSRAEFSPWHVRSFDQNDTVKEQGNAWFARRTAPSATTEEQRAAQLAAEHADTPALTILDSLGRDVISIAHNRLRDAAGELVDEKYLTFTKLDAEGKPLWIRDARKNLVTQYITPPVANNQASDPVQYAPCYDIAGNLLFQHSMDAGERWMLNDAAGKPMVAWDSRGHAFRTDYDPLHRPTGSFVKGADPLDANRIIQFEKLVYGDTPGNGLSDIPANDQTRKLNLRGKPYRHHDTAGLVTSLGRNPLTGADEAFDFKGNLLRSTRQLLSDYKTTPDWSQNPALEVEIFASSSRFDALNRPVQMLAPHSDQPGATINVARPAYNAANLLERVDVWLEQAAEPTDLLNPATADLNAVTNIDYDARGRRTRIEYNEADHPVITDYSYDPETFRLVRLLSTRPKHPEADKRTLQDLSYHYDPVGNITAIRDAAQQTVIFDNSTVEPSNAYVYDALYRLIRAEGREHAAQNNIQRDARNFESIVGIPFPNSPEALQRYSEDFNYDPVGNIMGLQHTGGALLRWNRRYQYAPDSNRLLATRLPGEADNLPDYTAVPGYGTKYGYDEHGNITSMLHLPVMEWDFKDQLRASQQQVTNGGTAEKTWYVYDASGQRVRKVTELPAQDGQLPRKKGERIYLGSVELYRKYNGNGQAVTLERETHHVMDDKQRVALIETRTRLEGADPAPRQLVRFQLGNHLGSAALELDEKAEVISYEEYHPYGGTAYQSARSLTDTPKRYRYTGKERDEETGFSYHRARYYTPWLGRWTSCDPGGVVDGPNQYCYAHDSPMTLLDPGGRISKEAQAEYDKDRHSPEQRTQDTPVDARKEADKGAAKSRRHANSPRKNPSGIGKPKPGDEMAHMAPARHNKTSAIPNDIANDPKNIKAMPASGKNARVTNPDGTFRDTDIHAAHEDLLDEIQARSQKGRPPGTVESSVAAQEALKEAKIKSEYMTREHFDEVEAGGRASAEKGPPVDPSTGEVIKAGEGKGGAKFRARARGSQGGFVSPRGAGSGPKGAGVGEGFMGKAAGVAGVALLAYDLAKAKNDEERVKILANAAVGAVVIGEIAEVPVVGPWVAAGVTGLGLGVGIGTVLAKEVIPDSAHEAVGKFMVEKGFGASANEIEIIENLDVFGWRPFAP
jgi:RHS repeat-associated protein